MKPSLSDSVMVSTQVLAQEVVGEMVLLDLASETYFGLDDVGTRIWQLLQEHSSLRAIFDLLLEEFDVEPARLEEDVLRHVGELAGAGLVSLDAKSSAAL